MTYHKRRIFTAVPFLMALAMTAGCGRSGSEQYSATQRRTDLRYALGMGDYEKLEAAARDFLAGTNECILDVRDRGVTYEGSRNCRNLELLSIAYLALGGDDSKGKEPTPIKLKGQEALKYVWMARSISELGGGMQSAWVW